MTSPARLSLLHLALPALATLALLVATGGPASAVDDAHELTPPTLRDVVVEVDASEATIIDPITHAAAGSNILYVNRCEGGETIYRGYNDSRTNRSSIVSGTMTFPEYPYGDAAWNQVMAEVRDILAPFAIEVTDVDPGNVSHFEIIACGESFRGSNVLGVAPSACGVVENAIGYAFAEEHGSGARHLAETIAHEAAHTWGMDHLYDCEDPMTYLSGCGNKYFQDADLQCAGIQNGQWATKQCKCGGPTQNSFQTIASAFGGAEPTPPEVAILEPADGASVDPGFVVRPEIVDTDGIAEASLYVDGTHVRTISTTPYVFNAPDDLAGGAHEVEVRAVDQLGAEGRVTITVFRGEPCQCTEDQVCVDGKCIDDGGDGGLGSPCEDDADCASGVCADDGATQICTEFCADSCPDGYSCEPAGDSAVCWPAADGSNDVSGGCTTGSGGQLPLALALFVGTGVLLAPRRRRRS